MLPEEIEHVKEPTYDRNFSWSPFYSCPVQGVREIVSGRNGNCITESNSVRDTIDPIENGIWPEHPEDQADAKSQVSPPALPPQGRRISEAPTPDRPQTSFASISVFVDRNLSDGDGGLDTTGGAIPVERTVSETKPIATTVIKFIGSSSSGPPVHDLQSNEITNLSQTFSPVADTKSHDTAESRTTLTQLAIPQDNETVKFSSTFTSVLETDSIRTANPSQDAIPFDDPKSVEASDITIQQFPSDVIRNTDVVSPVEVPETAAQIDTGFLVKPQSHELVPVLVSNIEIGQMSVAAEFETAISSKAITCPATVSPTDPSSTRLRYMIANSPTIILCPGVYDGLSARIALNVGFQGMYMTGAGTTASCLGASDLGIAHLHDMRTNAEMIANLQPDGPPLIADMDTGYGGPLIISRAVKAYARAGVAAFHIEDQVPEKRCGHLSGKEVVDVETYLRRIRACVNARAQIRSDIVIIARTDAFQSRGYDECIERLRRARDLGADMGILEGLPSKKVAVQAVRDLAPWPLCYNSVENGHSPLITAAEAQAMGYRLMIFSFAGIGSAYMAILETFTRLKEQGVTGSVVGPKRIFEVCGLEDEMRIDEAAGGSAFVKGV